MLCFMVSDLLIWPSEAGKGEEMRYAYKRENVIVPVFGKEPETGIFIAHLRAGE